MLLANKSYIRFIFVRPHWICFEEEEAFVGPELFLFNTLIFIKI